MNGKAPAALAASAPPGAAGETGMRPRAGRMQRSSTDMPRGGRHAMTSRVSRRSLLRQRMTPAIASRRVTAGSPATRLEAAPDPRHRLTPRPQRGFALPDQPASTAWPQLRPGR